ncbi:Smoothelin [Larimichthys crocea]|uniref:Uncharacterized protein n=1 Tax=Larimichthys crocea TaxID=215358 RepID=A0ACD3Q869_LARCR|nr:Smoothelin [Larimichthys crocea]
MPGVNLDFVPASEAPETLGSLDSPCAESGLEEALCELLAQEEVEDEDEQFCKRNFELTLQCAVGEVHTDLQVFWKRVNTRLEEAATQVAPLVEAFASLQEENLRLRIQQERLVRQVETLCQVMGLPDPLLYSAPNFESSPLSPCETKTPPSHPPTLSSDFPPSSSDPPPCTPQDSAPEAQHDTPQDCPSSSTQGTLLETPSEPQDTLLETPSEPQDNTLVTPSEPQDTLLETPNEPQDTLLETLSEPQDIHLEAPSEPQDITLVTPSEPQNTLLDTQSEPQNTLLDTQSEPQDTLLDIQSEPQDTLLVTPSEPQDTLLVTPSEPQDTFLVTPSEPQDTLLVTPSEPQDTLLVTPSEPQDTLLVTPSELQDTLLVTPSEPQNTLLVTPSEPQDTLLVTPSEPQNTLLVTPSEPQDTLLDTPCEPQETISCPQDSNPLSTEISTLQNLADLPVPHPPTFATHRSLSAPSVMADISCDNSVHGWKVEGMEEIKRYDGDRALLWPLSRCFQLDRPPRCRVTSQPSPTAPGSQAKPNESSGKLTEEQLAAIEDEELLDKMLDESKDFEERRLIRAAMRDLRKKKRDQREKEREARLQELRQQREERTQKGRAGAGAGEVMMRKVEKSADGSSLSQVTKTDRFAQSDDGSRSSRSTVVEASYVQKTDRGTVQSKSYSFSSSTSSSSSNASKKVGSVFDREDDTSSRSGGLAAIERRQADRRKELMRAQTMPKASAMQARKAMIEKFEKDGGGPGNQAVAKVNRVQRSTSFGVPNANSIKQMLLDWCRAKTRSYEHVDIQNFSSSWSNGMAFCALVHNFFPEAFDYSSLSPSNRRQNFEVAFSNAEKLVDCPQLLDVDDMVKMREPDWKCVYTYLQEFYRGLVTKGLVKTKNSS